jgi:hypothetical protein
MLYNESARAWLLHNTPWTAIAGMLHNSGASFSQLDFL